ncbi:hypothetical protein MKW94_027784 [Papaver nudicaule]|uniref:Uncharacterized protein n=1 Tax=Papaver nudicaule TaxID=74823 RepID=A0AA41UVA2_PAPNU|nr:hypothetical protein [Papaver nudicaule]
MKLTVNKALDLNSISVLSPHSRRPNGSDSSIYNRASQLRSQQPQTGISSQGGISSLSQNYMDNILKNEQSQRFGSQERDKRISCLAPTREETQMLSYKPRWGPAAPPPVTDRHKCQVSEKLEHRTGQIETKQNRQGMVLESIQGDVMQVKKQMQENALDIGVIKQKLASHDNSLLLVFKGEEDIKTTLEESFKSLPDQFRKEVHQEIVSAVSSLQNQRTERMLKLTTELSGMFTNSVKAITSSLQPSDNSDSIPSMLKLKERDCHVIQSQNMEPAMDSTRSKPQPKYKAETRQSSKQKTDSFANAHRSKMNIQDEIPLINQDEKWRENYEPDEELDGGFACLLGEKETGIGSFYDGDQVEAEQILKKARRNRKHNNVIVLD